MVAPASWAVRDTLNLRHPKAQAIALDGHSGAAYLDRAAPRFARAKFLVLAFARGLFIEPGPGSNFPGWIIWPGRSALDSRFLAFCPAFAFARWRALALVIISAPWYQWQLRKIVAIRTVEASVCRWRARAWADLGAKTLINRQGI